MAAKCTFCFSPTLSQQSLLITIQYQCNAAEINSSSYIHKLEHTHIPSRPWCYFMDPHSLINTSDNFFYKLSQESIWYGQRKRIKRWIVENNFQNIIFKNTWYQIKNRFLSKQKIALYQILLWRKFQSERLLSNLAFVPPPSPFNEIPHSRQLSIIEAK